MEFITVMTIAAPMAFGSMMWSLLTLAYVEDRPAHRIAHRVAKIAATCSGTILVSALVGSIVLTVASA